MKYMVVILVLLVSWIVFQFGELADTGVVANISNTKVYEK